MSEEQKNNEYIFSEETVQAFSELGEVLRKIRQRLIREGIIGEDTNWKPPH